MAEQKQLPLIAGPSREELFDALRLRHERRTVAMTASKGFLPAREPGKFSAEAVIIFDGLIVNGITIEDGSGNNWLLTLRDPDNKIGSQYLEGYFNTATRKGWIRPISS